PCAVCGKNDLEEKFRKLISNLLPKAVQSEAASRLKMQLKLDDQLCYKHYNELVPFNKKVEISKLDAVVRACDESLLSQDGYRRLAAVELQLIREHHVAAQRIEITDLINKTIKIRTFSVGSDINSQPRIQGEGAVFDQCEIGDGAYRSIRSILTILLPIWKQSSLPILILGDTIKLKLGGDGHNVG
ncbi:6348_t:CDS:2, partial [Ambispora leptoticha]